MPRIKKDKPVKKVVKQKLSKEQRSQIARDRWAKIKAGKASLNVVSPELRDLHLEIAANMKSKILEEADTPAPPIVEQETLRPDTDLPPVAVPGVEVPAPQLAPVASKKQKRYTGPKEFSGALKAAEKRLAKAINERAEAMGKLAGLNAEIPSLLQIINALKGSGNSPAPYDLSAPNGAFQAPVPQTANPLAAIQAAMDAAAQPPIFKASGGAVQLSPDAVGTLEGPEDDDIDKYITGASGPVAEGKWIGG